MLHPSRSIRLLFYYGTTQADLMGNLAYIANKKINAIEMMYVMKYEYIKSRISEQ